MIKTSKYIPQVPLEVEVFWLHCQMIRRENENVENYFVPHVSMEVLVVLRCFFCCCSRLLVAESLRSLLFASRGNPAMPEKLSPGEL